MSVTGEMPVQRAPIGENSTVKLSLVITLVGLAFGAGAAHWRIGALETSRDELRRENTELRAQLVALDKSAATKSDVAALTSAVTALTIEVRTFIAGFGGTRTASHQPRGPGR